MQRAAASAVSSPSNAASGPSTTQQQIQSNSEGIGIDSADARAAKRRRISEGPIANGWGSNPQTPSGPDIELQRARKALEEKEAKRDFAIEKLAAEAGETRWVLSTIKGEGNKENQGKDSRTGLKIVRAGYEELDGASGLRGKTARLKFGRSVAKHEVSLILL